MQFGKEFMRQNSFYKCVINEEEIDLDSADVFELAFKGKASAIDHLSRKNLEHLSFRDENGASPLHYASAGGHLDIIRLIVSVVGPEELNVQDEQGRTPLHWAVEQDQLHSCALLLELGADPNILNSAMMGPLHLAVTKKYNHLVEVLLQSCDKTDANLEGDLGNTPVMLACCTNNCDAIQFLFKHGAKMCIQNKLGHYAIHTVAFAGAKEAMELVLKIGKYGRINTCKRLLETLTDSKMLNDWDEKGLTPLHLASMAGHTQVVELLLRSGALFQRKVYGSKVHLLNLAVYLLGLLPLTYLILNLRPKQEVFGNNTSVIMVPISFRERINYFTDFSNPADWGAAISSLVFVIPMCFNLENTWQWEAGAFAILTSWIAFLLYFQRFERIGIYVVMFGGIVRTLLCIMILFIFLLLAFGLAFYALMLHQDEFSSISLALAQTFVMTVGELNYQSTFQNAYENGRMAFPGVTYFIFVIFVLLMPILLMNLMIGLAVGDIAEVQRNAELKRIAMQIDLHTALEKKLPYWFLKRVDKPTITIYPNKCKKVLMQALIEGEIQNTVRTRLKLCSRQGGPLERELHKQKNRLKAMSCVLEKQHNLLKLIIQKMEITSEADEYDGPHNPRALKQPTSSSSQKSKWVPLLQAIKAKK
ncbi:hypothetical protein cypCar_00031499 [Cyprinus carpio]|nr:hypothetical protein cypCar_00031499 [Cyprinus carpio]